MGARQRLNGLYLLGILIIAALFGIANHSLGLFLGTAIVLAGVLVHGGSLRFGATSKRRPPPRIRRH